MRKRKENKLLKKVSKIEGILKILFFSSLVLLFLVSSIKELSYLLDLLPQPFSYIIRSLIFPVAPLLLGISLVPIVILDLYLTHKDRKANPPDEKIYHLGDYCPKCGSKETLIKNNEATCMSPHVNCKHKRKIPEEDKKKYDVLCPRCHHKDKYFSDDGYLCAQCGKALRNPF